MSLFEQTTPGFTDIFNQYALSNLAAKGEMAGSDLRKSIEIDLAKAKNLSGYEISPYIFYHNMHEMQSNGYVTGECRQAQTVSQRNVRDGNGIMYYNITPRGRKRRSELAEKRRTEEAGPSGAAVPQPG